MSLSKMRGVPTSIAMDAWWFSEVAAPETPRRTERSRLDRFGTGHQIALGFIALIWLADFLFLFEMPGVSLVIFDLATTMMALISLRPRQSARRWGLFWGLWVVSVIPAIDFVQFSSLLILWFGQAGLLIWAAQRGDFADAIARVVRFPIHLIIFGVGWLIRSVRAIQRPSKLAFGRGLWMAWGVPIVGGSLFLLLFFQANPVFEAAARQLTRFDIDDDTIVRSFMWVVFAAWVAPFVGFSEFVTRLGARFKLPTFDGVQVGAILNGTSVMNSLIIFNAMFLLQNFTDGVYFWGGVTLPEGMNYATYAHRGAYPLMATASLAVVFVLLARPFVGHRAGLRALLGLWIAQNLLLVVSALGRLDLYVDVYGLTYLRVRVGIAMVVVAVVLGILAWQLWRRRSNGWVLGRMAVLGVAVLYAGSLVNFGEIIARHNLAHTERPLDHKTICGTLPHSAAVLVTSPAAADLHCNLYWSYNPRLIFPTDWRSYGFRMARVQSEVAAWDALQAAHNSLLSQETTKTMPLIDLNLLPPQEFDQGHR